MNTKQILPNLRPIALTTLALIPLSLLPLTSNAQNVDNIELEEVTVTGSRIKTDAAISAASPVQVLTGEDIALSGKVDIAVVLRETPALQGSTPGSFSAFNAADTTDSDLGVSLLNLRSLGIERTLVLQNGRRHVAGVADQASVDVNTIPSNLIKQVEVLTGGASSIYGADAVSGVVNFVLRDGSDFDGAEFNVQTGISSRSDAEDITLSIANGFEFANGKGDAVFSIEHSRSSDVFASDRSFAGSGLASQVANNAQLTSLFGLDPSASNTFVTNRTLPISSPLGVIAVGDGFASAFSNVADNAVNGVVPTLGTSGVPIVQVFDNGVLRPFNFGDVVIDPFNASGGDGIAATPDVELILPDSERTLLNFNFNYELAQNVNFFSELKYANSNTRDSVQVNGFNDDIPIALDNPFIPTALRAQLDSLIAEGISPVIAVSRDVLDQDVLPVPEAERDAYRIVAGINGSLFENFEYEVYANYGRTEVDVVNDNTRIEDRYFAAIDAVTDPVTGNPVCRSSLDPTAIAPVSPFPNFSGNPFGTFSPTDGSCAPINIFGQNSITGAGADFAFIRTVERSVIEQQVFGASLSGDTSSFLNLPGGAIGLAAGFEYRKEESSFTPDPLNTAGFTAGAVSGGPTSPSGGEFDVTEAFAEIKLPLVSDARFAKLWEVGAAGRVSDYDTIGNATTWSVSSRFQPVSALTFRGSFSSAVRAPNIGELFSPQQPAQLAATDDPCNPQFIGAGTQFRATNCAQFVAPGFNSANFNSAFVPGLSGGNPLLEEETAETLTLGFVLRPDAGTALDGLQVIVDYYRIEIEDAIDDLAAFDIAQSCVDLPSIDNQFCQQIQRDPVNGNIVGFTAGQINLGAIETEGVDFSIRYGFDLSSKADWGQLSLSLTGTSFLEFNRFEDPTDLTAITDDLGVLGSPDLIVGLNAAWNYRNFNLGWTTRYESSQLLIDNADFESDPNFSDPFETDDAYVHDLTAGYQYSDKLSFYGGVNNVFNEEPFLASLNRPAGPRGTFFFLGARYEL